MANLWKIQYTLLGKHNPLKIEVKVKSFKLKLVKSVKFLGLTIDHT